MKKVFSLLLVLAMCLSLFACTKAAPPEEEKLWVFDGTNTNDVDKTVSTEISVPVSGSYRNADTSDGELSGKITINKFVYDGLTDWRVYFHILEEDETSIDFSEDDVRNNKIVLKTTVDDYTEENILKGIPLVSDLSFVDDRSNDGKGIYDSLYDGKNVDCVINVGYSSEYKFTI
ncbi:MAG: hypothetical protein U0L11_06075, partial [Acutalibacteraceae bacterium]|nr:hypothetical protein [Acutalibacteraceae bacterium]